MKLQNCTAHMESEVLHGARRIISGLAWAWQKSAVISKSAGNISTAIDGFPSKSIIRRFALGPFGVDLLRI